MGRIAAVRREDRCRRLMDNLARYGLREPTTRKVAFIYENRGAGAALVELYRLGWKVCQSEGRFLLVRDATKNEVGEEDFEE